MKKVCVSFSALYETGITNLHYGGYIDYYNEDGEREYYDLRRDEDGSLLYCDGEIFILKEERFYSEGCKETEMYCLVHAETQLPLYLSKKEYNIAVFEPSESGTDEEMRSCRGCRRYEKCKRTYDLMKDINGYPEADDHFYIIHAATKDGSCELFEPPVYIERGALLDALMEQGRLYKDDKPRMGVLKACLSIIEEQPTIDK